ncbi:MAG: hypothetical protein U1F59_00515 [Candidatus Competibacteraceae bacterium]
MSIIDQLKEESRQRSRGVVPPAPPERESPDDRPAAAEGEAPEPPKPPSAAASSDSSASSGYCAFWIERLESVRGLPPEAAAAAVRDAIRAAPARHRPPEEDARLFAAAGGRELPYGDVVAWLRLRAAAPAAARTLEPEVARFWRDRLGPPPALGADAASWSSRCRAAARAAARVGRGLDPATVAALAAYPDAVPGYLSCAASPVHRSAAPAAAPAAEPLSAPADGPKPGGFPPPAAPATVPATFGTSAASAGSRMGFALGGLVGGVVGGVADGYRAGVAGLAKFRSRPGAADDKSAGFRARDGDPELRRAAAEAERALAAFTDAARQLDDHPRLAAFWREVDQQADGRFAGARDGVLREMATRHRHPLHLLFEHHARDDPNVALHHQRALDAFGRLQTAWEACALAHQQLGKRWAPAPEQTDTLRAACRRTPAAGGQPALVDQAERLLRALAQAVREACDRQRGRTPSP